MTQPSYRQQVHFITKILILIDAVIIVVGGYAAYFATWFISQGSWWMEPIHFYATVLGVMFLNNYAMAKVGFYSDRRLPSFLTVLSKILYVVVVDFVLLMVASFILDVRLSRVFVAVFSAVAFLGFLLEHLFLHIYLERMQREGFNTRRILLVGSDKRAAEIHNGLMKQKSWGHKVVGCLTPTAGEESCIPGVAVLGTLDDFEAVLLRESIDEVVFALPPERPKSLKKYLDLCLEIGVSVRIVPGMFDPLSGKSRMVVESIQGTPTIAFDINGINASGLFYKRVLDFVGGLVGMILLGIMAPLVALAIKLDSPGPILFKQRRVGQHGRVFWLYKFRTMHVDAEHRKKELMSRNEMNGHMFKIKNDPRVTRVGRVLRKYSLDEFPQFINVMKGEISLVGTRPPTLDEVEQYEKWHRRRMSMKPGITGMWQVSGRNVVNDFDKVVLLDLKYMDGWRFSRDLWILLKTVWIVLARRGAS
jgi:exopolysaccharide biosynthesis polyprenyl glycosylphosphotransferase